MKEFKYDKMTPELSRYLKEVKRFREQDNKWYKRLMLSKKFLGSVSLKLKEKWNEPLNKVYRECRNDASRRLKKAREKAGNQVDEYNRAKKLWMCRPETQEGEAKEIDSPSGRYNLVLTSHQTGRGTWNYTACKIYQGEDLVDIVIRNYGHFPYEFAEGHPNGHDYLICGEDYQGQTIIELDTKKRREHLPKEAEQGFGFCWAGYKISPSKNYLAVSGCYWGAPYETRIIDFSDPMENLPIVYEDYESIDVIGWKEGEDDVCELGQFADVYLPLDKDEFELTDEEWDNLEDNDDLWEEQAKVKSVWRKDEKKN